MLELNEKLIRKGKPVGLPYVGSKKKISKKIVEIIKQNFGTDKTVYDVFGGGGAITADLDKTITDMFNRVLSQDREWIKTLIISREEFMVIRDKDNKTVDDELKLLVNSFGNNRKDYLYGKELSDIKYNLAVDILEKEDVFSGYKKTETYQKSSYKKIDKNDRLQQLQRLEQLERLQQLNMNIEKTTEDYHYFSDINDSVLYLDPPYENSDNGSYTSQINYQAFYDWVVKMSKNNIVMLSSYEVSDDRFECVYNFDTAKSTFQIKNNGQRTEKLFMFKESN